MATGYVRLERRASDRHVVSVEIPDDADARTVATAAAKLRRVVDIVGEIEDGCPVCFAFRGMFHDGQCSLAGPNEAGGETQIEAARRVAIAEGMRP